MKQLFFKRPTNVRNRAVASVAAAALALISVGLTTGVARAVDPAANPDLPVGCGADLTLVLDDSNSLWNTDSLKQAVATAAQAFANGFRDTNSTLAVVRFNTTAATMSPRIPLTGSAYSDLDDDFLDGPRPPGGANGVGQGGTNWEAALQTANTHVASGGTRPKLVVMITDGQPTVSSDSGNGSAFSQGALDDGITQANLIKGKGAHILALGVGSAFSVDQYKAALASLSGTDVFPTANWPASGYNRQANFVASGPNTTDAVLVTDFDSLAVSIAALTAASCRGSLTIAKHVVNAAGQTFTTGAVVDGWQFNATRPNSGYEWMIPASGGAETRSSTTGEGDNLDGVAAFQWDITGANGNVGVAETVKSGYTMTSVSCQGGTVSSVNLAAGSFNVGVAQNASVACVVTNTETPIVDISLTKTILGSAPYLIDTQRTYRISATNGGPAAATGVEVKDTLPAGFTSPSVPGGSGAVIAGNIVTWTVGNLAVGQTKTLDITGTLSTVGSMTNWTQVNKTDQTDSDSTPNNCSLDANDNLVTPEDDCAKVTIPVTREYTLDIDKVRVGTGPASVGDQIQYDLKVKNLGPSTATSGLVVTDTLPGGLTNVSFAGQGTDAANWSCPGSPIASTSFGPLTTFTCTYNATLAKDAERTIRVTATVGAALADVSSIENNACVKKSSSSQTNDDCDDEDIDLTPKSDLTTTKTTSTPSVVIGGAATWKYNVTNIGPSKKMSTFTVTDTLPNGLSNVVITPGAGWSNCTKNNAADPTASTTFTCTFTPSAGGLLVGGTTTDVTVSGTTTVAPAEGTIASLRNDACVEDNFPGDSNDCSFAIVAVTPQVDLTIDKNVDKATASVGDVLTYTFEVTNLGPSAAQYISFDDTFDAGLTSLTIVEQVDWDCQFIGQTLACTWEGGLVAKDASTTTVKVTAIVGAALADAAKVDNTACVGIEVADDNNDCDTTTTELTPSSDLTTTKTTSTPSVVIGGAATWKYNVTNNGPSKQLDMFTVTDTLPDGLSDVTISGGAGWVCPVVSIPGPTSSSTFVCTFTPSAGGLAVGGTTTDVTVTGTTTVAPAEGTTATLTNEACVEDNFPNDSNDCSTADVTVTPLVDLTIDKSVDVTEDATVGDVLTYSFKVQNLGPSAAQNISFSDTFDAGLTNVTLQDPGANWDCSVTAQVLSCDWLGGLVAKDAFTTPDVVVTATVGIALANDQEVSNTACVSDGIVDDENDCDTTTTELDPTFGLAIEKEQVEANPVPIGSEVTYTLEVANEGPSTAPSGFVVTDPVPALLTATSASGTDWNCEIVSNEVSCTFEGDDLAVGPAPVITVKATVTQGAANQAGVTNEACVTSSLVPLTRCDSVVTEFPQGDLELEKSNDPTVDEPLLGFGGEITYTVEAKATGTLDQTNVVVTDTVPGYGAPNFLKATLVADSAVCIDNPVDRNTVACDVSVVGDEISWNVGTVTAGTSEYVTFTVTVDLPTVEQVDAELTEFLVRNVAFATSDYTEEPVESNEVDNVVQVNRITGESSNSCVSDTPLFSIDGSGFYGGETVKMRLFENDQTTLYSDNFASATADDEGNVQFADVLWPGYSVDPDTGEKTYPGLELRPIYVQFYGSPATEKVAIAYPAATGTCDGQLSIEKTNTPSSATTITEFGAEIDYSITVSYPEGSAYNAEDVVITDILPGYDAAAHPESGTVTYVDGSLECADFDDLEGLAICEGGHAGGAFYDDATKAIKVNLGQIRPGDTRTVTFTVTVDEQGTEVDGVIAFDVDNRATVTSAFTTPAFDDVTNPVAVEPIVVEPEEPAVPADDTEVLGTKLPATGAAIGAVALLGSVLVGAGVLLTGVARRREDEATLA